MTVYAHWTDPYNMGDETYSFENYKDSDSDGHCFGMSITSAGYHLGLIAISRIGGDADTPLYSFSPTQAVKQMICFYQGVQGVERTNSTVAGGTHYMYGYYDIASDWQEVVNYVRDHSYDGTGFLQIGIRRGLPGHVSGHAVNFLRYENVNGEDRIYAYDNNFPQQEVYFYQDSSGYVYEAPESTFRIYTPRGEEVALSIECICLRDVRIYFNLARSFDATHVLYMRKDSASVQGYTYTYMEGDSSDEEYVMYEIPSDQDRVIIIPAKDNAHFNYLDTEYSFGKITDETRGELMLASPDDHGGLTEASFRIFEIDSGLGEPDFTLPSDLTEISEFAFEGTSAKTIYVPDKCVSIGNYAFRNAAVTQIRIPAGCTIAESAFDGCASVKIFGTTGSSAEAYCGRHENCTFVSED